MEFIKYNTNNLFKLYIIILLLLVGCSSNQKQYNYWVSNGTEIQATKYKLDIDDTSKIIIEENKIARLSSPPESLITNQYSIKYSKVDTSANIYFRDNSNQQVVSSLNPNFVQYFKVEDDSVLLIGYIDYNHGDTFSVFEPPLIISKKSNNQNFSSKGKIKTFNFPQKSSKLNLNAKLKVKIIKKMNLSIGDNTQICYLKQITLSRDAKYAYGDNNLILPDAILIKTNLVCNERGIPIAEWSIKSKNENEGQDLNCNKDKELYIEFIKYKIKKGTE